MNDWVVNSPTFEEDLMNGRYCILTKSGIDKVVEMIKNKDKEIEMLNNIINKIEKRLISDKCFFEDMYKKSQLSEEEFKKQCPYTIGSYDHCVEILNNLQELKGSVKS